MKRKRQLDQKTKNVLSGESERRTDRHLFSTSRKIEESNNVSMTQIKSMKRVIISASSDMIEKMRKKYSWKNENQDSDERDGNYTESINAKTLISKALKDVQNLFFKMNYLVLNNQVFSLTMYQIVLLIEFLQLLFFIFFKVQIRNEFQSFQGISPSEIQENQLPQTNNTTSNITSWSSTFLAEQDTQIINPLESQVITIHQYFEFFHPVLYTLRNETDTGFISLLVFFMTSFCSLVAFLFVFANRLQQDWQTGNMTETLRYVLMLASLGITFMVKTFEIPFATTLLYGHMCEEEITDNEYALSEIQCSDNKHLVLRGLSTVGLISYFSFLTLERRLFYTNSLSCQAPWASFDRGSSTVKSIYKFILTSFFVFGKETTIMTQGLILLACALLTLVVIVQRFKSAIFINIQIQATSIFYENLAFLLLLVISLHLLATDGEKLNQITISLLVSIFIASVVISAGQIYIQQLWLESHAMILETESNQKTAQYQNASISDQEVYLATLYTKIKQNSPSDQFFMQSLITNHLQTCTRRQCLCMKVFAKIDRNRLYAQKTQEMKKMSQIHMHNDGKTEEAGGGVIGGADISEMISGMHQENRSSKDSIIQMGSTRTQGVDQQTNQMSFQKMSEFDIEGVISQLEQNDSENIYSSQKAQKAFFMFLAQIVQNLIEKHPREVSLRLIYLTILKDSLNKNFKSVFELFNSKLLPANIQQKYELFQIQSDLEQKFLTQTQKDEKNQFIEIKAVYQDEQLFSKYLLYEFQAVHAAHNFWVQLLQKNLDSDEINKQSLEVSRAYHKIYQIANQIQRETPNNLRIKFKYAIFQLKIMNNTHEAMELLKEIQQIYENRSSKRSGDSVLSISQLSSQTFGENTASGLIIFSVTPFRIGEISHVNQELEYLLDYRQTDLQSKSISLLFPYLIQFQYEKLAAKVLFRQNFDLGKALGQGVIQGFAVNKRGYIVAIDYIVKVYPQLQQGGLTFLTFLQKQHSFRHMKPLPPQFDGMPHQFILTDDKGFITNFSEGLLHDMGLHSSFFSLKDLHSINKSFNIMKICPSIHYPQVAESFESEGGQIMIFDTTSILQIADLEQLSMEVQNQITENLGVFQVYTQFKELVIDDEMCTIHVFRVVVVKKLESDLLDANGSKTYLQTLSAPGEKPLNNNTISNIVQSEDYSTTGIHEGSQSIIQKSQSISSCSGSSETQSVDYLIREFKARINERKTPRALNILNNILKLIILSTIVLTSIGFYYVILEANNLIIDMQNQLYREKRFTDLVQLASNARSMINVANNLEYSEFDIESLNQHGKDKRFGYLSKLVLNQAEGLKLIQDYISQNMARDQIESEKIRMYKLDLRNQVQQYQIQYRVALYQYLNGIQSLNQTNQKDLWLPDFFLRLSAFDIQPPSLARPLNETQRTAFTILTNGLLSLRPFTDSSWDDPLQDSKQYSLLILLLLSLPLSLTSLTCILYYLNRIQTVKSEVISIFGLMKHGCIAEAQEVCAEQLALQSNCSLLELIEIKERDNDRERKRYGTNEEVKQENSNMQKRRRPVRSSRGVNNSSYESGNDRHGKELYANMIKKLYQEIKNNQEALLSKKQTREYSEEEKEEAADDEDPFEEKVHAKRGLNKQPTLEPNKAQKNRGQNNESLSKLKQKDRQRLTRRFQIKINDEDMKHRIPQQMSLKNDESQFDFEQQKQKTDLRKQNSLKKEQKRYEETNQLKQIKAISNRGHKTMQILNVLVSIMLSGFFILTYSYHDHFLSQISFIKQNIPMFFKRYNHLILSYSLLRERIISNNSLSVFEQLPGYENNLDKYYHELAIENERALQSLKTEQPPLLSELINFLSDCDSPRFCGSIIGENSQKASSSSSTLEVKSLKTNAYQNVIDTVMKACLAAFKGDLQTLRKLKQQGLNFDLADYDGSGPLYYAIRGNQTEALRYILQYNVNVNVVDRWGGTPLNFVTPGSEMERLLLIKGAKRGKLPKDIGPPLNFQIDNTDLRLMFAAAQGNMRVLRILQHQGWRVNVFDLDGRTPLHLAACSNNLEVTKFLVEHGADVMYQDLRGNNALADAIREGFHVIVQYLDNTMSESILKQSCSNFAEGLFNQGLLSAIGTFRKKFEDLQIKVNQTHSYPQRLSLLQGTRFSSQTNRSLGNFDLKSMKMYFQTQELYLTRVIDSLFSKVQENEFSYANFYMNSARLSFGVFITFQILTLLILRGVLLSRMKREVFENRGILNLIPGHVFDQNKQEVEALIKKIKD